MATINTDIAQNIGIIARAGDSFNLQISITDSSSDTFDLTGYKVYFEIKSNTNVLLKGLTNDVSSPYSDAGSLYNTSAITLTATAGIITVSESATNMDFTKGNYKYIVKLKSSTGEIKTWMYGKLKINDD